jgi:hypothetical protein
MSVQLNVTFWVNFGHGVSYKLQAETPPYALPVRPWHK